MDNYGNMQDYIEHRSSVETALQFPPRVFHLPWILLSFHRRDNIPARQIKRGYAKAAGD